MAETIIWTDWTPGEHAERSAPWPPLTVEGMIGWFKAKIAAGKDPHGLWAIDLAVAEDVRDGKLALADARGERWRRIKALDLP